ncbi:hypothetical protein Btru_068719 [Bulinus truncatus]|nr:hypothetical protein Btru_068719 [Bulinus truncatus]
MSYGVYVRPRYGVYVSPHYGVYVSPRYGVYVIPRYGVYVSPRYGVYVSPRYGVYVSPRYGVYVSPRYGVYVSPRYGVYVSPRYGVYVIPRYGVYVTPHRQFRCNTKLNQGKTKSQIRREQAYLFVTTRKNLRRTEQRHKCLQEITLYFRFKNVDCTSAHVKALGRAQITRRGEGRSFGDLWEIFVRSFGDLWDIFVRSFGDLWEIFMRSFRDLWEISVRSLGDRENVTLDRTRCGKSTLEMTWIGNSKVGNDLDWPASAFVVDVLLDLQITARIVHLSGEVYPRYNVTTETSKCTDKGLLPCDADNRQCFHNSTRCNSVPDCDNGRDESPEVCECRGNQFRCNLTHCINILARCDGSPDCVDARDEDNCVPTDMSPPL